MAAADAVETFDAAEAAQRAGTTVQELDEFVRMGIIAPAPDGRFPPSAVRRIGMVCTLAAAGIPVEGMAAAIRGGQFSLDFLDQPAYQRLSAFSGFTFDQLAQRSGVPVELLLIIREAGGFPAARPGDRVRDEELPHAEMLEVAIQAGISQPGIERLVRVQSDSLRRMTETESAFWTDEVLAPARAAGRRSDQAFGDELANQMSALMERAILAMYHLQQMHAWTKAIIEGLELQLAAAGLYTRVDHPPAMCFLDITGYTRLTQERGDVAAADLAERLGRLVQRTSIRYGGRPVKWLGDGVMFHFPDPGKGVVAAIEMVAGVAAAGLPPAHVGLHAGPVIFQEGDYYGQTVNIAARIADYARPGEVLVSQEVVEAAAGEPVSFREIGPVELKGVGGAMILHAASRAG